MQVGDDNNGHDDTEAAISVAAFKRGPVCFAHIPGFGEFKLGIVGGK